MPELPQASPLSRRNVSVDALGTSFALAVQPVSAATLSTSAEGLVTSEIELTTNNGKIGAYTARPKQVKNLPTVLVVHEIFGVHEHIKDVCRRLAQQGYLAIAPDLFARVGDVSKLESIDEVRKIVGQAPDAQVLADLDAAAIWAQKEGQGHPGKLGITGFCWGGRIVWLYAGHSAKLKAGAAWYGRLVGDKDPLHPQHPIDVAGALKAPVLGLYGGKDQGIPLDSVEQMRAALAATARRASKDSEIQIYPEAGHAFYADYRPSYREPDAEDAFKRMLDWFETHGLG